MKKRIAKKTNDDDVLEIVNFIKDNMMTKSEGATKEELAKGLFSIRSQMATKDDIANMATKDDIAELRERIVSLEKGQEKIFDTLEPLSRAHDKDSLTLIDHGKRITRIERHISVK